MAVKAGDYMLARFSSSSNLVAGGGDKGSSSGSPAVAKVVQMTDKIRSNKFCVSMVDAVTFGLKFLLINKSIGYHCSSGRIATVRSTTFDISKLYYEYMLVKYW